MRGLYVHIPFCAVRCHYCNFITTTEHTPELRDRFFKALFLEIKHVRERFGHPPVLQDEARPLSQSGLSFETLYFGGGTPSSLNIPELGRLNDEIHEAFDFKEGYEFTCEFNPGDGDKMKLQALRKAGVNRISLGCQSFRDDILQKLGRRHTTRDIVTTIENIRKAGIHNISFDLMLRLPGQTVEDFHDSVQKCIDLDASQVSLYDLEVHGGTPFGRSQKEGRLDLPGEDDHVRMYKAAIEMLTGAGYEHYEISNFAKPGVASRHNLIYWHNQEYLGLGPGAFTYLNGTRSQLAPDLLHYLEKCKTADWKNDVEDKLSEEEKETETLAMGLRLREGIAPHSFPKIYPVLKGRLETLCAEGFMEKCGNRVRLTTRGKFLSENMFGFLLEKEDPEASKALVRSLPV